MVAATTPPWRKGPWRFEHVAGPARPNDLESRRSWAERAWTCAAGRIERLHDQIHMKLDWGKYPSVFGIANFAALVESRDRTRFLADSFASAESISVEEVIAALDAFVELWERQTDVARAAGRFRGRTRRQRRCL